MRRRTFIILATIGILSSSAFVSGCNALRPTPVVIYITATPAEVAELPTLPPDAPITPLFGPTLPETAVVTFRPLSTSTRTVVPTRAPSLTPSFTPEFTETPIPPIPTVNRATARACAANLQPNGFTTVYQRDRALQTALGCPQSPPISVNGATLRFDNGVMLWASAFADQPRRTIYALFNNGAYLRFDDNWTEGVDPVDPGEAAPPGKKAPIRGFGKVWKNNPTARNGLGWAVGDEAGTGAQIQRFERGEMLYLAALNQLYIFVDGKWRAETIAF
jgi:hypothetical protein